MIIIFDALGRISSFTSKITGREFLTYRGLEDNWKLLVLTDGHPVYYLAGREQTPVNVEKDATSVTFFYSKLVGRKGIYDIDVAFTASLVDEEAHFQLNVTNHHTHRIREAWYPIFGGFEGFEEDGKRSSSFRKSRILEFDIMHEGLPRAEYLFVTEGETAHYHYPGDQMQWIDFFSKHEGLYISSDDKSPATTVFRLEKHPSEYDTSGGGLKEPRFFRPVLRVG